MLQNSARIFIALATGLGVAFTTTTAQAVSLPAIKASAQNKVPACVTPGRLMRYLKNNNPRAKDKFDDIAMLYMRHGEPMGLRWDFAFFQMLVETGFLRFNGDVKWTQNNFAGLGATGGGVRGEAFQSVSDGVKAHLEHLKMYSGSYVENPTAERTRKIQEWKVLASWQKKFKNRAMTFKDMAGKWAPGSHGYPRDIEFVGERFMSAECNRSDPAPELVQIARKDLKSGNSNSTRVTTVKTVQNGQSNLSTQSRYNLGAATPDAGLAKAANQNSSTSQNQKTAALSTTANQAATNAKSSANKTKKTKASATCRVWSASYGGTEAVIIKAIDKNVVNYTVLKVNSGRVKPETNAYIHAYAKGGEMLNSFSNPDTALKKAFELCPEG